MVRSALTIYPYSLDERSYASGSIEGSKVGKGKRLKQKKRTKHLNMGDRFAELMTKNFQKELKNSEIWDQMVAEFGEEKAENIAKKA